MSESGASEFRDGGNELESESVSESVHQWVSGSAIKGLVERLWNVYGRAASRADAAGRHHK